MSRIFDALRRSEQERTGQTPAGPPDESRRLQDIVASLQSRPPDEPHRSTAPPSPQQEEPWSLERVETCYVRTQEPVVAQMPNHLGAEKFRVLCHRLRQLRQQRPVRSVLVSSAIPKEGKTVVALNLAITLAYSSARVLLVDTDMRRSGLHEVLGLPSRPGLAEILAGSHQPAEAVRKVQPFGLYCLPAGAPPANPVELLQSPRMAELLDQVAKAFDWVIIDSPPLNPFADARCVAGLTDAALLVVRSGWTPRDGVQQALAALEGASIAGVVLNGITDSPHDHYYYSYYHGSPGASEPRAAEPPSVPAGAVMAGAAPGDRAGMNA